MNTKSLINIMRISFIILLTGYLSIIWAASTGKIAGQIIDKATNEPVPGANIVVEGTNMGGSTDIDGFFAVLNLPPGIYTLEVSMIGYASVKYENVSVSTNQTTNLEIQLSEEAIAGEAVVVVGERPVVQLDVSASQKIISVEDIQSRPVDNLEEILSAEAGVSFTAGRNGQGLLVRGGHLSETDILIDGMSTRNLRNQQASTAIALSSIQEIELLTGGFNAEYGDIRSGMVSITTIEGSPDKYSISFDGRLSPPGRKHFGPSPYGINGPWWSVYAGPDAMTGITQEMVDNGQYLRTFIGWEAWSRANLEDSDPSNDYTPQQALEIWKWQHRKRNYADKSDYIGDVAISGPIPYTPITFLLSQRYEDLQLAYPMSRNNSISSTTLLKLTHKLSPSMKLSLNNNFILVRGVSSGAFDFSTGIVTGTREGTQYALDNVESGEGGGGNWMWYEGAYNPIETRQYSGSLVLNHVLNPTTFYDLTFGYTQYKIEQKPLDDLRNTDPVITIGGISLDESPRGFSGYITEQYDISGKDFTSGGGRGRDNSKYWGISIAGDLVSQLSKYHEVKIGFDFDYTEFRERREENHDELTTPYSENPRVWFYYNASPIRISGYVQDKMEFEGLIANVGLRVDHMTPGVDQYNLDPEYIFENTPYGANNFIANGNSYRDLQITKSSSKTYFQPRLGISHPISEDSKVFFNYGHFLQPPVTDELFLTQVSNSGGRVPNLGVEWPKTIAYELGVEKGITDNLLVRFTGFYKDVSNELTTQNIISFGGTNDVETLRNNIYRDIRGFELRVEKRGGKWWYGWLQGEYLVQSQGKTGRQFIYEDRQLAALSANDARQITTPGVPALKANITLFTPPDYGPQLFGNHIFGNWRLNWLQEWTAGGQALLNEDAPLKEQIYVDVIDDQNTDILLEKRIDFEDVKFGFYIQVKNLFNFKGFPNPANYNKYVSSLKFPHEKGELKGNDKLGEWDKDYIDLGWNTWSQFVNPRDIFIGVRFNF